MTEQQRLLWLPSMLACAEINQAMQGLTGMNYNTGEQNKDMTKARQSHDWKDTLSVLQYLLERNPFSSDPSLRNIATGVHAHPTVNVNTAHAVGAKILTSVDEKTPTEYTFNLFSASPKISQVQKFFFRKFIPSFVFMLERYIKRLFFREDFEFFSLYE